MKRERLNEIIELIEANAKKERNFENNLKNCDNPQTKEMVLCARGAANAYENVLEALRHNDTNFLRIGV